MGKQTKLARVDPVDPIQTLKDNQIEALRSLAVLLLREVDSMRESSGRKLDGSGAPEKIDLLAETRRFEHSLIRCALVQTGGKQVDAAELLGIPPSTLCEKLKRQKPPPRNFTTS